MPPSVNETDVKRHRNSKALTDYKSESPGRSHYTVGQEGWEEGRRLPLEWATVKAPRPVA